MTADIVHSSQLEFDQRNKLSIKAEHGEGVKGKSVLSLCQTLHLPQSKCFSKKSPGIPFEGQTHIIGRRFLLEGHKGTSYSPQRSCPIHTPLPTSYASSPPQGLHKLGLEHGPFHWHNEDLGCIPFSWPWPSDPSSTTLWICQLQRTALSYYLSTLWYRESHQLEIPGCTLEMHLLEGLQFDLWLLVTRVVLTWSYLWW